MICEYDRKKKKDYCYFIESSPCENSPIDIELIYLCHGEEWKTMFSRVFCIILHSLGIFGELLLLQDK